MGGYLTRKPSEPRIRLRVSLNPYHAIVAGVNWGTCAASAVIGPDGFSLDPGLSEKTETKLASNLDWRGDWGRVESKVNLGRGFLVSYGLRILKLKCLGESQRLDWAPSML